MYWTHRLCLVSYRKDFKITVQKHLWKRILRLRVEQKMLIASEMTKWFNTNYHYIVPEFDDVKPILTENRPLTFYQEAKRRIRHRR